MVFGPYARYYDLLYNDKDTQSEKEYIVKLLQRYTQSADTILDLGCGTGRHDLLLARDGYTVTGVDVSEEMLVKARESLGAQADLNGKLRYCHGDIRSVRLKKLFDVVVSLFHVMSYQTANADLLNALNTAKIHSRKNGIFIFDCWYGPSVLTTKPEVRVKKIENEYISVTRIAEPVLHPNINCVDVHYTILIRNKETKAVDELHETHRMRYLFKPEIEMMLATMGFNLTGAHGWMNDTEPDMNTWGAVFIARQTADN